MTDSFENCIRSYFPGRLRARHASLKNAETVKQVKTFLAGLEGVRSVEINPRVGSLLLLWDPAKLDIEQLKALALCRSSGREACSRQVRSHASESAGKGVPDRRPQPLPRLQVREPEREPRHDGDLRAHASRSCPRNRPWRQDGPACRFRCRFHCLPCLASDTLQKYGYLIGMGL